MYMKKRQRHDSYSNKLGDLGGQYARAWWDNHYAAKNRIKDAAKQNKTKSKSGASRKVNAADVSMNNSNYN